MLKKLGNCLIKTQNYANFNKKVYSLIGDQCYKNKI